MKTLRTFLTAILAVTLSFNLASCSDSDDDPIVLDPTVKETIAEQIMAMSSESLPAVTKVGSDIIITATSPDSPIEKIVITKEGKAIVYPAVTRSSVATNTIECTYTLDGDDMIINAGGTLGTIRVSVSSVATSIFINSTSYNATSLEVPAQATATEVSLCRNWSNTKYRAAVWFDKLPVYGANDNEMTEVTDIRTLKNNILDKVTTEDINKENFNILKNNLVSAYFLNNKTVYFTYSNGNVEESSWKWLNESEGKFETYIDGGKVIVDVRFKKGTPNTAYFVIEGTVNCTGNLGKHVVSGKLICTMTD